MSKRIWSVILTLCLLLGMAPLWAGAAIVESGTCGDGVKWTLDDNGTLTISGAGDMTNPLSESNNLPWYDFRESIETVVIERGVTSICYRAFIGCSNLTSVTIPDGVTSIDSHAFESCSSLTSVTIPDGVTVINDNTFLSCSSLTSVAIPDSVTSIGDSAFYGCRALSNVTIPNSVSAIDRYAFYGCVGLTSVTIPNGVTVLSLCAFYDCINLASVTIPDSVTAINQSAFLNCDALADVYYGGTRTQWNAVTINDTNDGNAVLHSATIHCTDGILNGSAEGSFAISPERLTLVPGATQLLTVTSSETDIRWAVTNANVAAISSETGNSVVVTALNPGQTEVTAQTASGQIASCIVTVSGIVIAPNALTLEQNKTASLTLGAYGDAQNAEWTWTIAPEGIATVERTASGCDVQAIGLGNAVISCTNGVYTANCEIAVIVGTVESAVVTLSPTTLALNPGGTGTVSATTVAQASDIQWSVENRNVAAIFSTNGYVVTIAGVTSGETVLTAQAGGGPIARCRIIVSGEQPSPTPDSGDASPDDGRTSYAVTFNRNGGAGSMNGVTVSGASYTLPQNGFSAPSGMRFRAWRVEDESGGRYEYAPGATIAVSSDLTVTALWENDTDALAQGYCGANGGTNLTWTLSRDWNLTVSGAGEMESYDEEARAPWYGYHTNIRTATLENGVSSVGSHAFTYCAALEEVALPETLSKIEDSAFLNCAALEEINLPASLRTMGDRVFYGCESLSEVAIPEGLSDTGNYAFEHCAALETVSLPASLTRIGYYAFHDCAELTRIDAPSGVRVIDIGAFRDCAELTTVTFPQGLTNIQAGAFAGCESLYNTRYAGTVAQFAEIAQRIGPDNEELKANPVHCSDGDYDWTPLDPYRILDALQDMDDFRDQTWRLAAALTEFKDLYIDDIWLTRRDVLTRDGMDYVAEEGSVKLTIPAETFRHFDVGSHTAAAEFFGDETRTQIYTVFPKPGEAKIDLQEMLGVTGVENVSYNGRFRSDPLLEDGLYRFTLISGEIPPGLTLRDGGYFTGVARTAGTYFFTVGLQIKRNGAWSSGYEDTAQIAITVEPGTEVKVEAASDPGYEIIQPVPDQVTETVMPPEQFQLASIGPFEEFRELYIDGDLKIRDLDYEARPCDIDEYGVPHLLEGGILTGTYIAAKTFTLSQGVHAVSLEFEHTDPLGNKKTQKATQTVTVAKRDSSATPARGGGGGGGTSSGASAIYYSISKANVSNGSLSLGQSSAKPGATVTISATPADGFQIGAVTVIASNKTSVPVTGGNGSYSFTMPSRRVTVNATFTRSLRLVSVTQAEHGALSVSSDSQAPGQTVTVSTKPDPGYLLIGVTVRAAGEGALALKSLSANVFSFVMPSEDVTVNAVFTPKLLASFKDIQGPDWFFDDAEWAYKRGIIRGVTPEQWDPQKKISGVTAIITLERLDGVNLDPYYTGANDGLDNNAWYVAAARWAVANGIYPAAWGVTDELPMNRGEFAIVLYNFLRYRGLDVSAPNSLSFTDAATLTTDELMAFRFLQSAAIFQGYEDGTVKSKNHLNRAQLSALLHRLSDYVIKAES